MGASPGAAFSFLVETLIGLYLVVLMLRILLEAVRADYYNPVSQVLLKLTEPVVAPVRRVLPRMGRINVAALVVLYLIQYAAVLITMLLAGYAVDPILATIVALRRLVRLLLMLYLVLIIVGVILSWVGASLRHPVVPLVGQLTEPVLAPIRRVIPPIAGLDLSPLVALIAIQFLFVLFGL